MSFKEYLTEAVDITRLNSKDLEKVLQKSGYTDSNLIDAELKSSTIKATYEITYMNDGEEETGNVYVFLKNGKLVADF